LLEIQKFCRENPDDYAELLEEKYAIKTKYDGNLVLFKYNQIKSDFTIPLVRECRGIILEKDSFDIVCRPMEKFMNYGESSAAKIDWDNTWISSKEDGSLIKLFYYGRGWKIATNGTINAFNADLTYPLLGIKGEELVSSFGGLFFYVLKKQYGINDLEMLNGYEEYTHMFELCSRYNKVVVDYKEPKVFYISSKHKTTGEECHFFSVDTKIPIPETAYSLKNLNQCIEVVERYGADKEGLVVRDKDFNRIKIKGKEYVRLHRIGNNGVLSPSMIISLILSNETEEYLSYYPENKSKIYEYQKKYKEYKDKLNFLYLQINKNHYKNKKEFAEYSLSTIDPAFCFSIYDNKNNNVEEYISGLTNAQILKKINK
jgi:hypothetical protein